METNMFDGLHTPETYEELGLEVGEARAKLRIARAKLSELEHAGGRIRPAHTALEVAESSLRAFLFEEAVAGADASANPEERERLGAAVREARAALKLAQDQYAGADAAKAEFNAAAAELEEARDALLRAKLSDLGAVYMAANKAGTLAHAALQSIERWAASAGHLAVAAHARRNLELFPNPTQDDPQRLERTRNAWFAKCDTYGASWASFATTLSSDAETEAPPSPKELAE
jgi:chromosome segregation ATPase